MIHGASKARATAIKRTSAPASPVGVRNKAAAMRPRVVERWASSSRPTACSAITDPRVNIEVRDVNEEVYRDQNQCGNEHDRLDERKVASKHRLGAELTDAWPGKH